MDDRLGLKVRTKGKIAIKTDVIFVRRRNIGKKMKKSVFICDKVIIFHEDGERWMLVITN